MYNVSTYSRVSMALIVSRRIIKIKVQLNDHQKGPKFGNWTKSRDPNTQRPTLTSMMGSRKWWEFPFARKLAGEQEYVCNVHLSKMSPLAPFGLAGIWSIWRDQTLLQFSGFWHHLPTGQGCTNWHPDHRTKGCFCCWGVLCVCVCVDLFRRTFLVTCWHMG